MNPYQNMAGFYSNPMQQQMPFGTQTQFSGYIPQQQPQVPVGTGGAKGGVNVPGMLPIEESYIENIWPLTKRKLVNIYATYEHSTNWNTVVFTGIIEAAVRDHVILSDSQTGIRSGIPTVEVDYVEFV